MILSGGASTKRHILSPTQFRLSRFLLLFIENNQTNASVAKSFNSEKLFNTKSPVNTGPKENVREIYKSCIKKNQLAKESENKRSYHTTAIIKNHQKLIIEDKTDSNNIFLNQNSINIFLDKISNVINESRLSDFDKQTMLERKLEIDLLI